MSELSEEDAKLVVLARSARSRIDAATGAAVRDLDGRSYAAASIGLPSLRLTGLELAVAQAVAAGAVGLEAAAVVGSEGDPDLSVVRELGGEGVAVHVVDDSGVVTATVLT